jgi:tetratricopeptide (TPR) repeat protein
MRGSYLWICSSALALLVTFPVSSQSVLTSNKDADNPVSESPYAATAMPLPRLHLGILDAEQSGDRLMAQHRYQAALETYRSVDTPSAKLWNRMGVAYQLLFALDDSIRCYKKSLQLDSNNPLVLNNLATAYDQMGDHRQAEALYRKAISVAPNSATYLKNLGTNLLAQHEYEGGSDAYRQALALDPHILDNHDNPSMVLPHSDNAETNYARARSCAQADQKECALVYLRKALDEGPSTAKRVSSDPQFKSLINDPAIKELLALGRSH